MPAWLHVILCVTVPAAWGGCMVVAFNWLERRTGRGSTAEDDLPPIDYSI